MPGRKAEEGGSGGRGGGRAAQRGGRARERGRGAAGGCARVAPGDRGGAWGLHTVCVWARLGSGESV
eukprot:2767013-Rhodomonas_salina.1